MIKLLIDLRYCIVGLATGVLLSYLGYRVTDAAWWILTLWTQLIALTFDAAASITYWALTRERREIERNIIAYNLRSLAPFSESEDAR